MDSRNVEAYFLFENLVLERERGCFRKVVSEGVVARMEHDSMPTGNFWAAMALAIGGLYSAAP